MSTIRLLSAETIDRIAAGEVVERPSSVVKELVENAIDAGAGAITVEIREGGISLIRITDNGEGIRPEEIRTAFLRHATSKINVLEDLQTIRTLGFRGEALSSISAVSMTEMITKTAGSLTGVRYRIEGGEEKGYEEIGAPEGTTILVRNLFYNVPARKKFLKSASTEAGYISSLMERLALSNPDISFQLISNGQTKLHTSGNGNLKDIIYAVYGREAVRSLVMIPETNVPAADQQQIRIFGMLGKPSFTRGNRSYEICFVNGRYIKSPVLSKAIEEGYGKLLMQHRYPFAVLFVELPGDLVDINVHPAKMEVRFSDGARIFELVKNTVSEALAHREMVVPVSVSSSREDRIKEREEQILHARSVAQHTSSEPFERLRKALLENSDSPYQPRYPQTEHRSSALAPSLTGNRQPSYATVPPQEQTGRQEKEISGETAISGSAEDKAAVREAVQMQLFEDRLLSRDNVKEHHIIGQLFDTYWLVEFRNNLYIIDQHAAHEKVNYERLVKQFAANTFTSQQLSPPLIVTLTMQEEDLLTRYETYFRQAGFAFEHFGGRDYQISAVPDTMLQISDRDLFISMLDSLESMSGTPSQELFYERFAAQACKASVKGGDKLRTEEADALIGELLDLEDPYHCPHGRPTIISMSKYDLERKFGRS